MRKKIVTILGARPQFVKAAVLSRIIQSKSEIEEIIIHTGQHFESNMSDVFFEEMQIPKPKYNLQIHSLGHGAMTGQMLEKIEELLIKEQPQAVVVYGDTNSTIAGALAAKKLHMKVVHVEAGLRSYNLHMPEEINRILTDRIADLLSCPTDKAVKNLKEEGFEGLPSIVRKHGDIMKDSVQYFSEYSQDKSDIIKSLKLEGKKFVLATVHRQENTDDPSKLKAIFNALDRIATECQVVLPLHPRTKSYLQKYNIQTKVTCIDPVGYFDMLELLKNCDMVLTDSGGLQKEAFFCEKCCVIMRTETEWVELVHHGFAEIAGSDSEAIVSSFMSLSTSKPDFSKNLYGSNVGEKIYSDILNLMMD